MRDQLEAKADRALVLEIAQVTESAKGELDGLHLEDFRHVDLQLETEEQWPPPVHSRRRLVLRVMDPAHVIDKTRVSDLAQDPMRQYPGGGDVPGKSSRERQRHDQDGGDTDRREDGAQHVLHIVGALVVDGEGLLVAQQCSGLAQQPPKWVPGYAAGVGEGVDQLESRRGGGVEVGTGMSVLPVIFRPGHDQQVPQQDQLAAYHLDRVAGQHAVELGWGKPGWVGGDRPQERQRRPRGEGDQFGEPRVGRVAQGGDAGFDVVDARGPASQVGESFGLGPVAGVSDPGRVGEVGEQFAGRGGGVVPHAVCVGLPGKQP
ncbi:hypothetical protein GCM10023321_73270 [Pseudonocardia eucalypti]|uniref:Mutator family transposase n=1 Tax=Pseudonocardia eucalypti TaxID=648755 RepID=A0ABP9R8U7_9PSEU